MSKHTPGPWKVGQYLGAVSKCVHTDAGDRGRGTDIVESVGGIMPGERAANARLIAAAPELLEALKEALSAMQKNIAYATLKDEAALAKAIPMAQAAITKAEGAQP